MYAAKHFKGGLNLLVCVDPKKCYFSGNKIKYRHLFSSTTLAKRNETINTTLVSAGCVLWTQIRKEQTWWNSSPWRVGDPSRYSTTARVIHSHYVWSLKLRVICTLQFPRRSITSCGSWETTMILLTCLIEARTTPFPQVLEHSSTIFNLEVFFHGKNKLIYRLELWNTGCSKLVLPSYSGYCCFLGQKERNSSYDLVSFSFRYVFWYECDFNYKIGQKISYCTLFVRHFL